MSQLYGYNTIVSNSQDLWKINSMHKHISPLFPAHRAVAIKTHFPTKCSQLKLNLKYLAIGGHWRVQEIKGPRELHRWPENVQTV